MQFQLAAARLALAAFVPAALLAAAAVGGVRLGLLSDARGFSLMIPAAGLGLAALLAALVWLGLALGRNEGAGKRIGLVALIGSVLLLWTPLTLAYRMVTEPPIHDVTTDTEDPPRFVALLKQRGPGSNAPLYDGQARILYRGETDSIDYVLHEYYPDVTKPHSGFVLGAGRPAATLFWRAFQAAKSMGWSIVDYSEKDGRIEATDTSFWFGRVSDIVIRVRPAGMGARTDMRSQSRDGAIDYGDNAARIKKFFKALRG